jgi:L-ascorbate metabolism protein UlaG (beta-lactamase superfamily)
MDPEEAMRAHLDLRSRLSIGTHFGCFQLTDEGIDDPLHALEAARRRHGVPLAQFRALEVGETLTLARDSVQSNDAAA